MKIKVINPNTTLSMTALIGEAAAAAASPGTEIVALSPAMGPVSIEGHHDEAFAAIGVIDEVRKGEAEGCDGYVIACFGDPGLLAAREAAAGPVIGIAEAAMHVASLIASGFSVVTTLERTTPIAEHLVRAYGMTNICRGIRATELAVLELEDPANDPGTIIRAACERAIAEDRCGAIILGCAGMADLAADLSRDLGVPVIDGVAAAVKLAEALVGLGLATSKHGDYARPLAKTYTGEFARFGVA